MDGDCALLVLEDGFCLPGISVGYSGNTGGEVVFNTAMTGYQEILSDPSYAEQIVTLTYPHIGNTGINTLDNEASRPYVKGLIIADLSLGYSNWRAEESLEDYLKHWKIVAIAGVDTRALTQHLRLHGALRGIIVTGKDATLPHAELQDKAKAVRSLVGLDLAKEVTCQTPYTWTETTHTPGVLVPHIAATHRVVVIDYGVKQNILRCCVDVGCEVIVLPAQATWEQVCSYKPEGVVLSNGPGDPAPCDYAIKLTQQLMQNQIPILGICLGHQILALAAGAKTFKMPYGHHGSNHPVLDLRTRKVWITSQNHGFAVDEASLPKGIEITHRSLFDGTIQGISLQNGLFSSFQGHPEASPGPHEAKALFQSFVTILQTRRAAVAMRGREHA